MTDFSAIASFYREKSLVQATAGQQLIDLLAIPATADILDVGCGTGNLTAELRSMTSGRVIGIDLAEGMIAQAQQLYADKDIEFQVLDSSRLAFDGEFDLIFCSSTFQWFKEPAAVLKRFHRALRPGGTVGIQAPATSRYSPNFITAINLCRSGEQLAPLFAGFNAPWFFLETAGEYRTLFEQAGFSVNTCHIDETHQRCCVQTALDIFNSGAAAGYLNQAYYAVPLPADFSAQVLAGMRESFQQQANANGEVELVFYRIYLVAQKTVD